MGKHDDTDPAAETTKADHPTVSVDLWDRTWTIPANSRNWDFTAAEALERGQAITFLRIVLGKQFNAFQLGDHHTAGDARDLMDALMSAIGEANSGE